MPIQKLRHSLPKPAPKNGVARVFVDGNSLSISLAPGAQERVDNLIARGAHAVRALATVLTKEELEVVRNWAKSE